MIVFVIVLVAVAVTMLTVGLRDTPSWRDGWEWYATKEAKQRALKRLKGK